MLSSVHPRPGEIVLRTVSLALVVSGLGMCRPARADDAEDKAIAVVQGLGGTVTRDEKAPGKLVPPSICATTRR